MSGSLFPVYARDLFGHGWGLVAGTLIGMAFGFVLERAGFGRARNLAAQFYLTDTRVLKVMFSAIVTAMVGLALLSGLGLVDLTLLTIPETFLWPQLVGGLLLGVGFIVSGYCPGTGVVAAASGNLDGAASLLGVAAGSLAFGLVYAPLESFYLSGSMGVVTLHGALGVPMAVVAAGVVAMAVGAFLGGEALERVFARRAGLVPPASPRVVKTRVFAGFAAVAGLALLALALPRKPVEVAARVPDRVDAVGLARKLVADPQGVWLLDLRPEGTKHVARIPGAIPLPAGDAAGTFAAGLAPTRTLVVYAEGDPEALPAGVLAYRGPVSVLAGGYAAWQAGVLTAPLPPAEATPTLIAEFEARRALHSRFTGAVTEAPKLVVRPVSSAPAAPKKGGGC